MVKIQKTNNKQITIFEGQKIRRVWDEKKEGNKSVTKCDKLKLQSSDGKFYKTDMADVKAIRD